MNIYKLNALFKKGGKRPFHLRSNSQQRTKKKDIKTFAHLNITAFVGVFVPNAQRNDVLRLFMCSTIATQRHTRSKEVLVQDYLSPWEPDERRGGLIAASSSGTPRESRESQQRVRKEEKERSGHRKRRTRRQFEDTHEGFTSERPSEAATFAQIG